MTSCTRPGCRAHIVWFETVSGHRQCFDAAPHPTGPVVLETAAATVTDPGGEVVTSLTLELRRARVLAAGEQPPPGTQRWMPHHATCTNPPKPRAHPYHRCAIDGCSRWIPRRYLMCRVHWRMVPPRLRDLVVVSYGAGRPSQRYRPLRREAIRCVELAEAGQRALLEGP